MKSKYEDIINIPHHVSKTRPQMKVSDRAARFSPFAALTGYDAAVKETARETNEKIELSEDVKSVLSDRLQTIADRLNEQNEVAITYFKPDAKKEGGAYITSICTVKKVDEYERVITITDGSVIPIDEIISIDGQIFETMCD